LIAAIAEKLETRSFASFLSPSRCGMQLLEGYFENLVDYKFTSEMETASGMKLLKEKKKEYLPYLKAFYSGKNRPCSTSKKDQEKKNRSQLSPAPCSLDQIKALLK
jgi:DNA topoisomerase IA